MVHGAVKPFMEAVHTKSPFVSPQIPMYTGPKSCPKRDLACFFQPLSKTPSDSVAEVSARATVTEKRSRHAGGHLPAYRDLGWFWWVAQLLSHLTRPSKMLARAVRQELSESGLGAALASGKPVLGLHIRQGDVCAAVESARTRRRCSPLSEYMAKVEALLAPAGPPSGQAIYLCTDSEDIIKQTSEYPTYRFIYSRRVGRYSSTRPPELWDKRIWNFYKWGNTEWTQRQALDAAVDLLLLARVQLFVGKFTSNFFRAAYALHSASCDCSAPYMSLDAPWCFDFGLEEGKNWEFPIINVSGAGGTGSTAAGASAADFSDRPSPLARVSSFQC